MTLAMMTLLGCVGGTTTTQPDASMQPDAIVRRDSTAQPDATAQSDAITQQAPFELQGTWLYLGPWDGEHTLKISNGSAVYTDINGEWSSDWTIKAYDNGLHHFQMVFESGTGTYIPAGQNLSATYVLSEVILTVQLTDGLGSYSPVRSPGSCTEENSDRISDCRLYMKQN
jgi:hypothetical protein